MTDKFVLRVAGTREKRMNSGWVPIAKEAFELAGRGYGCTITMQQQPLCGVDVRRQDDIVVATTFGHQEISCAQQIIERINNHQSKEQG